MGTRWLLSAMLVLAFFSNVATPANITVQAIIRPPPMTDGLRRDRVALQALRGTITRGGFGKSRIQGGWSTSTYANPCYPVWPHILCAAYRVVSIKLGNMGIRGGQLPDQLADMDKLLWLDLSGNVFSGKLSENWGRRLSFVSLTYLSLQDNALTGTLPRWNFRGAWAKLGTLNLQGNRFYGPLPTTWAGPNTPLRKVVTLDLSFNYLGRATGVSSTTFLALPEGTNDWGTASVTASGNPFPVLKTLDISENDFAGTLPTKWGGPNVFTALQTLDLRYNRLSGILPAAWGGKGAWAKLINLYLSGNDLGDHSSPGGLPTSWTSIQVPRAFPSLVYMMIFPGNDYICTWLNGETQYDARYEVVDDGLVRYGAQAGNMQLCPEPDQDNPPTSVSLAAPDTTLVISWRSPAANPGYACGFQASISRGATQVLASTRYVMRPVRQAPLVYTAATGVYSVATGITPSVVGTYTLSLSTLYCDGYTSSEVEASYVKS